MANEQPAYRAKIIQTPLTEAPPSQAMPTKVDTLEWQMPTNRGGKLKWITLSLAILSFIGFSLFEAVNGLLVNFDSQPVATSLLGSLLGGFVLCLFALIWREYRGIKAVNHFVGERLDWTELASGTTRQTLNALKRHAADFAPQSYAAQCYTRFQHTLNSDMKNEEVIALYRRSVAEPVVKKAEEVMKKESLASGSLSFISPNQLIQTLVVLWISLRTIRRISLVFGVRPSTAGNWKMFKLIAQNLAAYSIFDMATDEMANQISGALTAKLVENSADAVAAGALNVRLGKALIRLLK